MFIWPREGWDGYLGYRGALSPGAAGAWGRSAGFYQEKEERAA